MICLGDSFEALSYPDGIQEFVTAQGFFQEYMPDEILKLSIWKYWKQLGDKTLQTTFKVWVDVHNHFYTRSIYQFWVW